MQQHILRIGFDDLNKPEQVFYSRTIVAYCQLYNVPQNKQWNIKVIGTDRASHGITSNLGKSIDIDVFLIKSDGNRVAWHNVTDNMLTLTHELYHAYVYDLYPDALALNRYIHEIDPSYQTRIDRSNADKLKADAMFKRMLDYMPLRFGLFTSLFNRLMPLKTYYVVHINPIKVIEQKMQT